MPHRWNGENIPRRMAQVRGELGRTAGNLSVQAHDLKRELLDWRYYVRRHPWVALGMAAALGYLAVPRYGLGRTASAAETPKAGVTGALLGGLVSLFAGPMLRAGASYFLQGLTASRGDFYTTAPRK